MQGGFIPIFCYAVAWLIPRLHLVTINDVWWRNINAKLRYSRAGLGAFSHEGTVLMVLIKADDGLWIANLARWVGSFITHGGTFDIPYLRLADTQVLRHLDVAYSLSLLVKEPNNLPSHVLTSRLFMVHNPWWGCKNNVPKLTRGQKLDDPFLEIAYTDVVSGGDDASFVQAVWKWLVKAQGFIWMRVHTGRWAEWQSCRTGGRRLLQTRQCSLLGLVLLRSIKRWTSGGVIRERVRSSH